MRSIQDAQAKPEVFSLSLHLRLIVVICVVLLGSLIVGAGLTYRHAVEQVRIELHAAMIVGERRLRDALNDIDGAPDGLRRADQIVANFDGDRHLRASLVDGDGTILVSSRPYPPGASTPEWLHRLLEGPRESVKVALPQTLKTNAAIQLETDARNEVAEEWGAAGVTLTVMAVFGSLVLLLMAWTLAWGLKPLRELSVAFGRLGDGDYRPRVAETGPRELARLCQGFNDMVSRLAEARTRNEELQVQLLEVQEEERAGLARDLHDEVGPLLFAMSVDATMIKQFAKDGDAHKVVARAHAIGESVGEMQQLVKSILGQLRPGVLLDLGLASALDLLVKFWRQRHPDIVFQLSCIEDGFGASVDAVVYRVIQEAVSNAVRHGQPQTVGIDIARDDDGSIVVSVRDNGSGLGGKRHEFGFGLTGMRERVTALDGTLTVRSGIGEGLVVQARLPVEAHQRRDMDALSRGLPA
jgi:two-component system, NarL family, sensor histidine kinase UhpB